MFRIWGKIIKNNQIMKDVMVEIEDESLTRTFKVYKALDRICYEFDLAKPIWLEMNKEDFIRMSKTRFTKDSFIEPIDFDYLEFQVVEEEF